MIGERSVQNPRLAFTPGPWTLAMTWHAYVLTQFLCYNVRKHIIKLPTVDSFLCAGLRTASALFGRWIWRGLEVQGVDFLQTECLLKLLTTAPWFRCGKLVHQVGNGKDTKSGRFHWTISLGSFLAGVCFRKIFLILFQTILQSMWSHFPAEHRHESGFLCNGLAWTSNVLSHPHCVSLCVFPETESLSVKAEGFNWWSSHFVSRTQQR